MTQVQMGVRSPWKTGLDSPPHPRSSLGGEQWIRELGALVWSSERSITSDLK